MSDDTLEARLQKAIAFVSTYEERACQNLLAEETKLAWGQMIDTYFDTCAFPSFWRKPKRSFVDMLFGLNKPRTPNYLGVAHPGDREFLVALQKTGMFSFVESTMPLPRYVHLLAAEKKVSPEHAEHVLRAYDTYLVKPLELRAITEDTITRLTSLRDSLPEPQKQGYEKQAEPCVVVHVDFQKKREEK